MEKGEHFIICPVCKSMVPVTIKGRFFKGRCCCGASYSGSISGELTPEETVKAMDKLSGISHAKAKKTEMP